MRLIDAAEATRLYGRMGQARETSGGSAANTVAGLAALGLRAGFIGQVAGDQLGEIFRHDITGLGVTFTTPVAHGGVPTARCLILVTPDAQRTMNTFLGASQPLPAPAPPFTVGGDKRGRQAADRRLLRPRAVPRSACARASAARSRAISSARFFVTTSPASASPSPPRSRMAAFRPPAA